MVSVLNKFDIKVGYSTDYNIYMECLYLKPNGEINKTQELKSKLCRTIREKQSDNLLFTRIDWKDCYFKGSNDSEWMEWKFPQKVTLEHNIFIAPEDELKEKLFYGNAYNRADEHTNSLTEAFSELPKLPSVYLVIMQAFDMIAFEGFTSFILSNKQIFEQQGNYVEIKDLSYQQNKIGLGHYSENSFFKNGAFFFKYIGIVDYMGKKGYYLEYYCNESQVSMTDGQGKGKKEGKSFYQGSILINTEIGLPIYGSMHEHYLGKQKVKEGFVSSQVIRRIELKESG